MPTAVKLTVLGCGTSGGVPRVPLSWGACDPNNPKNRRRRVSVLVEQEATALLIDTSPDLREQLLDARVERLDGVFYTHDHADHTHGIDDLRGLYHAMGRPVDVWADDATLAELKHRFRYIFHPTHGYPAIAKGHVLTGPVRVGPMRVVPFEQGHGPVISLGYRIGPVAYSTDVKTLPESAFDVLAGVRVWVVDALRYDPHPTHAHLNQTLDWIARVAPERAILTHLNWDMDYETLRGQLPDGVEPAYDGLVVEVVS